MTSYLVYAVASMRNFPILSTIGDKRKVLVYEYFTQLTLKESIFYFRRVNDTFFAHYMFLFNKDLQNKRVSDEA